ncbi:hypothetical protein UR09_05895, partial [Candidatus Nitromaritima sp. SCGC AAA799-A02]
MPEKESKVPPTKSSSGFFKYVAAAVLLIGVILIGVLTLSLDSFRRPIMDGLSRATGLSIEIDSLHLSLSHGLSLRGGGLKVRSADGSREIFSAQDLFLDAELKPLLQRQLKIRQVTLVKPAMKYLLSMAADTDSSLPEASSGERQKPGSPAGPVESAPEPDLMEPVRNILKR